MTMEELHQSELIGVGVLFLGSIGAIVFITVLVWFLGSRLASRALKQNKGYQYILANIRYLAKFENDPMVGFKDDLSPLVASSQVQWMCHTSLGRFFVHRALSSLYPQAYEQVFAAMLASNEELTKLFSSNHFRGKPGAKIRQMVCIGPGLDSPSLRLNEVIGGDVTCFEVDFEGKESGTTMEYQVTKRATSLFKDSAINFLTCHFTELDQLGSQLVREGFDASLPTAIVIPNFVSFIKTGHIEAVWKVLTDLCRKSGGVLVMDFLIDTAKVEEAKGSEEERKERVFRLRPAEVEGWLAKFGCSLESYWSTNGLIRRLLRSDGTLVGMGLPHTLHVLYAQIDPKP